MWCPGEACQTIGKDRPWSFSVCTIQAALAVCVREERDLVVLTRSLSSAPLLAINLLDRSGTWFNVYQEQKYFQQIVSLSSLSFSPTFLRIPGGYYLRSCSHRKRIPADTHVHACTHFIEITAQCVWWIRYSVSGYFNFFNPTLFTCVCLLVYGHVCHSVCVEVKGQLSGVCSFLPCGSWGLISGQSWWRVPLPTKGLTDPQDALDLYFPGG